MQRTLHILVVLCFFSSAGIAQAPVEIHGQLQINGNRIEDKNGDLTHLRGMSFFWHQWEDSWKYTNDSVVKWLVDDWKINIIRVPVGVRSDQCTVLGTEVQASLSTACGGPDSLSTGKEWGYATARAGIRAAINSGIYVVIDWHTHNIHLEEAKEFFSTISSEFGDYPGLAYEIFNEPTGSSWTDLDQEWSADIKPYAQEIIAAIRENDPDNIIIVGTPFYSQFVDHAADDPILVDSNGDSTSNIAYTLHVYAGSHRQETRDRVNYALENGIALWMTEGGRVGTNFSPNNSMSLSEWKIWEDIYIEYGIPYTKWSLSIKNEVSSSLHGSASTSGGWSNDDLRSEGLWNRHHYRKLACPTCPGFELSKGSVELREPEGVSTVDIVLLAEPESDVVFNITTNDSTESSATPSITFTPDNWDESQSITISAVNDTIVDTDKWSEIRISIDHEISAESYDDVFDQIVRVFTENTDKKKEEEEEILSSGENRKISIYPNPLGEEELTILLDPELSGEVLKLSVLDLSGTLIFSNEFEFRQTVNVSPSVFINSGIYIMNIESSSMRYTHKVFKK